MTVIPTVGTSWAKGKHMNRDFGVEAGEGMAAGLPFYRAGSGFKDVSGVITASYRLDAHWSLGATGGVTRLLGDAADSPLNERRWQPSGFMSVAYTRSEEHTSELQSLMRISYAVFCLKKKRNTAQHSKLKYQQQTYTHRPTK